MVVVVEGIHDANKINNVFPKAGIVITNGSEINEQTIEEIKELSIIDDVYLCLDPDGPGNKIRNTILSKVNNVKVVYANQEKAISKNGKKVGIEHMKESDIVELFSNAYISNKKGEFDYALIYNLGLADSKIKRADLCKKLNLGYCNAKQLVKRLNMHGITLKEVKKLL